MTEKHLNWHQRQQANLSVGERAADVMRNGMGSWIFVGLFVLFMIVWAFLNAVVVVVRWDPYPFILLNLFLSMLAGLQGAILLIAAKRQDAIAAALAQHDYETNLAAKADIEQLMELNRRQLLVIEELRELMHRSGSVAAPLPGEKS
ncbi:MAG: DUF1003 domain-containing protein [Micrococcales bacterium]|nr:DUF1003 domain-containing protein [Micrococcales bacterium]